MEIKWWVVEHNKTTDVLLYLPLKQSTLVTDDKELYTIAEHVRFVINESSV